MLQACQYAIALMMGNAACWVDRLEVQGKMPTTFKDFECVFLEHYSMMADTNIAHDKLHELKQHGAIQNNITVFDYMVVSLPQLPEVDQVHAFVYGLKPYTHKFVKAQQ